jgi:hypothetical protein
MRPAATPITSEGGLAQGGRSAAASASDSSATMSEAEYTETKTRRAMRVPLIWNFDADLGSHMMRMGEAGDVRAAVEEEGGAIRVQE